MNKIAYNIALFIFFITTSLTLLAPTSTVIQLALLSLLPLGLFVQKLYLKQPILKIDRLLLKSLTIFAIWTLLTCVWSVDPARSMKLFLRVMILFGLAYVSLDFLLSLRAEQKTKLHRNLFWGFLLALLITIVELLSEGMLSRFFMDIIKPNHPKYHYEIWKLNRGVSVLVLILWPTLYYLLKKKLWQGIALWFATGIIIFLTVNETAKLAFFSCSLLILMVLWLKQKTTKIITTALVIFTIGFIAIISSFTPSKIVKQYHFLPASAKHRLCIWKFAAQNASQQIYGKGFDGSRHIGNDNGVECFSSKDAPEFKRGINYGVPLHPHNNLLQIWLELGTIGLALFLVVICVAVKSIIQAAYTNQQKALFIGVFFTYFFMGLTGYGLWQNWLVATLLLGLNYTVTIFTSTDKRNKVL